MIRNPREKKNKGSTFCGTWHQDTKMHYFTSHFKTIRECSRLHSYCNSWVYEVPKYLSLILQLILRMTLVRKKSICTCYRVMSKVANLHSEKTVKLRDHPFCDQLNIISWIPLSIHSIWSTMPLQPDIWKDSDFILDKSNWNKRTAIDILLCTVKKKKSHYDVFYVV